MTSEKGKKRLTKEQRRKLEKERKILLISGFAMTAIQFVLSAIFIIFLQFVDILPTDYKVLISVVLILFCVITFITQRWKVSGIITKVLALFMSVILVIGCVYVNSTYHALDRISGNYTKKATIAVYVRSDSPAKDIEDVATENFGIVKEVDRDNTNKTIENINEKLNSKIVTTEYDSMTQMIDALYSGTSNVIILNESYTGILSEMDAYSDFETKTKTIMEFEIITDVSEDNNSDYLSKDGVFTMYISGIDIDGSPTDNRNSDVNIICTVNTNTNQIFMINTPRDFYVPTSVSGGVKDKLTHAGCYGIDCSVETLEMLYGVNIDYYLKVNFTGFVKIIDELGGVDVNSDYAFVTTHGGKDIVVGSNHLTGEEALGFARERYAFGTGDRQRGVNQMAVIKAVIKKMQSSELIKNYTNILDAVADSMATNMSYDNISSLVKMQIDKKISWDIQQYSVNGTGDNLPSFSLPSANYVMVPDQATVDQAKAYLNQIYNNQNLVIQ